jgi:hypothetical protein
MEALNALVQCAEDRLLLTPLQTSAIRYRISLYADDLVVFVVPTNLDITMLQTILQIFAAATGLRTNLSKCQFTPIRCLDHHVELLQSLFPCQLVHFPFKYLGIPLSIYYLRKLDMQYLVDDVADRSPSRLEVSLHVPCRAHDASQFHSLDHPSARCNSYFHLLVVISGHR